MIFANSKVASGFISRLQPSSVNSEHPSAANANDHFECRNKLNCFDHDRKYLNRCPLNGSCTFAVPLLSRRIYEFWMDVCVLMFH